MKNNKIWFITISFLFIIAFISFIPINAEAHSEDSKITITGGTWGEGADYYHILNADEGTESLYITGSGTYTLSNKETGVPAENLFIKIESQDDVTLILDNLLLTNSYNNPVLYISVRNVGKVKLQLKGNSKFYVTGIGEVLVSSSSADLIIEDGNGDGSGVLEINQGPQSLISEEVSRDTIYVINNMIVNSGTLSVVQEDFEVNNAVGIRVEGNLFVNSGRVLSELQGDETDDIGDAIGISARNIYLSNGEIMGKVTTLNKNRSIGILVKEHIEIENGTLSGIVEGHSTNDRDLCFGVDINHIVCTEPIALELTGGVFEAISPNRAWRILNTPSSSLQLPTFYNWYSADGSSHRSQELGYTNYAASNNVCLASDSYVKIEACSENNAQTTSNYNTSANNVSANNVDTSVLFNYSLDGVEMHETHPMEITTQGAKYYESLNATVPACIVGAEFGDNNCKMIFSNDSDYIDGHWVERTIPTRVSITFRRDYNQYNSEIYINSSSIEKSCELADLLLNVLPNDYIRQGSKVVFNYSPTISFNVKRFISCEKLSGELIIPISDEDKSKSYFVVGVNQNGTPIICEDLDTNSDTVTIKLEEFDGYAFSLYQVDYTDLGISTNEN